MAGSGPPCPINLARDTHALSINFHIPLAAAVNCQNDFMYLHPKLASLHPIDVLRLEAAYEQPRQATLRGFTLFLEVCLLYTNLVCPAPGSTLSPNFGLRVRPKPVWLVALLIWSLFCKSCEHPSNVQFWIF